MSAAREIELGQPETDEEWERYYEIRYEVLRKPHGQPPGSEREHPLEPISAHIVAKVDGQLAGGVCWVMLSRPDGNGGRCKYARLRQIAVAPDFQGLGLATRMTDRLEATAGEQGAVELVVTARNHVVDYYRRRGYTVTGPGPTLFGDVEHTNLCKPLI